MIQLLFVFLAATFAQAATPSTVVEKTQSTINGELSVVDVSGVRFLVARANRRMHIQGSLDLENHSRLLTPYTQIVSLITALHPTMEDAFDMGLGGGTLPRFYLAQYPKAQVDSVEIDKAVVQLANKYFFVKQDRHHILEGDGYETLSHQNKKYDVIWMDEFTPKEGPKAMVQASDLKILRDHLKPDGILIVHLGTAKYSKEFKTAIWDYMTGFSKGIRVEGPSQLTESLAKVREAALSLVRSQSAPPYYPDQVIAVSNGKNLSCAQFWEVYKKWAHEKLIDLQWSEADQKQSCEELHP